MLKTKKIHQNLGLVLSLAAGSLLLGLVGCGAPGSDPTAQYSDLNAKVVPHKETARDQEVAIKGAYAIEVENGATIVEGEARSSFSVTVRMFQKVDSYELVLKQVPADVTGMTLTAVPGEDGKFQINWVAPKGTVPASQLDRSIEFKLELVNVKSSSPGVEQQFAGITREVTRSVRVVRTGSRPEIVAISMPSKVAQGSLTTFTVDVADPASYNGAAPRLEPFFQGTNKTTDGFKANGATYVRVEKVPEAKGGVWRYTYIFDAKNNDVGAQLDASGKRAEGATGLQTRMWFKAFSAFGLPSQNEKQVDVEITYTKPQPATVQECPAPAAAKAETKPAAAKSNATTVKPATTTKSTAATSKPVAKN